MDKKGAINLSINMIIVLIIAIIVLSFALSFITGMFDRLQDDIDRSYQPVDVAVNRDNPIGVGDSLTMGPGQEKALSVRVLNTGTTDVDTSTSSWGITCERGSTLGVPVASQTTISSGQTGRVDLVINSTTVVNNDVCTITVNSVSDTFFLKEDT